MPSPCILRTVAEEGTPSNGGQPHQSPGSDFHLHRLSANYDYTVRRSSENPRGLSSGSPSHMRSRHPQLSNSPDEKLPFSTNPGYLSGRGADQSSTSPTPTFGGRRQSRSMMGGGSYEEGRDIPNFSRPLPPTFPLASSAPSSAATNQTLHPNSANTTRNRRVSFANELSGPQNFTNLPALEDPTAADTRKTDQMIGPANGTGIKKPSSEPPHGS
ncbi:hypothetical protein MMC08_004404 [Hypocenomyce scalaris]|nr:hypothetical protein [Hypocenomyce scalaris]